MFVRREARTATVPIARVRPLFFVVHAARRDFEFVSFVLVDGRGRMPENGRHGCVPPLSLVRSKQAVSSFCRARKERFHHPFCHTAFCALTVAGWFFYLYYSAALVGPKEGVSLT